MITVFSTESRANCCKYHQSAHIVYCKIDEVGIGGYRSRWSRTTYGFSAMFDKIYTARVQLKVVFGLAAFSELWWKVCTTCEASGEWKGQTFVKTHEWTSDLVFRGLLMRRGVGEYVRKNKLAQLHSSELRSVFSNPEVPGNLRKIAEAEWEKSLNYSTEAVLSDGAEAIPSTGHYDRKMK